GQFGKAEIENFHVTVRTDHDVLRFDVAMDDARRVRRRQRADDLRRYIESLTDHQFGPRHSPAQRGALNELGGDEMPAAGFTDLKNRDDVGMVERGGGLSLLLETAQPFGVLSVAFRKKLDGDFAIEPGVLREVDFTHSPGTDRGDDLVAIKPSSCGNRHNVNI